MSGRAHRDTLLPFPKALWPLPVPGLVLCEQTSVPSTSVLRVHRRACSFEGRWKRRLPVPLTYPDLPGTPLSEGQRKA